MKRKIRAIINLGLISLPIVAISFPLYAQSKKPLTLTFKDAVYLGLRNNPSLESNELDRVTQKYALVVQKNKFEPQYTLTSSFNRTWTTTNNAATNLRTKSMTRTTNINPAVALENHYGTQFKLENDNSSGRLGYHPSLTFSVVQPLIQGFGKAVVDAALNDAFDTETKNKLRLKLNTISTINTIMSDYFTLVQSEKQLAVDQTNLSNNEELVKNDEVKIKAGQIAKADIFQDQAQVATSKSTIENDKNLIQQNKYTLLTDLGLSPDTMIHVPKNIKLNEIENILVGQNKAPSIAVAKKLILANNPQYQIDGVALRALRRSLITAKDKLHWKLDLTASEVTGAGSGGNHNRSFPSLTNHRNHAEAVGLALTIPVDDVTAKQTLLTARIDLEKAQIAYTNEERSLEITALNDLNSLDHSKTLLQLDKDALKLQQQTVNVAKLKNAAGQTSSFELIKNQQDLLTSEETLVNDTISHLEAIQKLDQDTGITLDLFNIKIRY